MVRSTRGRVTVLLVLAVLLLVAVLASLAIGSRTVPVAEVLDALAGRGMGTDATVVRDLRLPRTLVGLLVGLALGGAGALMQTLTRNPLADPGVLGVNAGASAAIVAGISVFGLTSLIEYVWFSLAGAATVSVAVYLVGSRGRSAATPARLALAGVAFGAVLQAWVYAMLLLNPDTFDSFRMWQVGSLGGRDLGVLVQVAPFVVAGILLALVLAPALNALALGEESARSLGVRLGRTRALAGTAIVLLAGAATAAAGPIVFVGLAVPHVVRSVVGSDQRWELPCSMLAAGVLLLGADVAGRVIGSPSELQVGVVTAFLGAPAFLYVVRRGQVTAL